MNDSKEFLGALSLARTELRQKLDIERNDTERKRLEVLSEKLNSIERVNICVCSFSEVGDSLSQWRAYVGPSAGFSVGFSTEKLSQVAQESGFSLYHCIYTPEVQKVVINDLIEDLLSTDFNTNPGYPDPNRPNTFVVLPVGGDFAKRMAMLAPLIKDDSFAEEREWRLVSRPINFDDLHHRSSRSMIIPFFKLPLAPNTIFDCLAEVVVGPTPHPELSKASAQSLLFSLGIKKVPVRVTVVPFRNW